MTTMIAPESHPANREVKAPVVDSSTGEDLSDYSMYPSTPPVVDTARKERFELDKQLTACKAVLGRVAGELGVSQWDAEGTELVARASLARNAASLMAGIRKDIAVLKDGENDSVSGRSNKPVVWWVAKREALEHILVVLSTKFSKGSTLAWADTSERFALVDQIKTRLHDGLLATSSCPEERLAVVAAENRAWAEVLRLLGANSNEGITT